jgi:hypothetical protein
MTPPVARLPGNAEPDSSLFPSERKPGTPLWDFIESLFLFLRNRAKPDVEFLWNFCGIVEVQVVAARGTVATGRCSKE